MRSKMARELHIAVLKRCRAASQPSFPLPITCVMTDVHFW